MILQQNYQKLIEYSQKAFKIYCRRSLGIAIIKNLQKKVSKQKQKNEDENNDQSNIGYQYQYQGTQQQKKISTSDDNLLQSCFGNYNQESLQIDSVLSQAKRTINNVERGDSEKQAGVQDKLQILYGDLVYIQHNSQVGLPMSRAKYFLNRLKFCKPEQIGIGSSSDLRCIFEIIYPGLSLQNQKKGTPLTQQSLVSFRNISKNEYLKVKNNKIVYSDEFGKQLELSKQPNQSSVFEIKYEPITATATATNEETIVSGVEICIKLYNEKLYMNILQDQKQVYFSQTPTYFLIQKVNKAIEELIPCYYRMNSNKFNIAVAGLGVDLESISQRKTITNVIAVNQKNTDFKINPVTFIDYDFTKMPEQDPKICQSKDPLLHTTNCWQLIQRLNVPTQQSINPSNTDRLDPIYPQQPQKIYKLYNPVIGLGLTIKNTKNIIKLTSSIKDFARLKVNWYDDDIISLSSQANCQELDIIYDRNVDKYVMVLSKPETQNQSKKIKMKRVNQKISYAICELTEICDVLKSAYEFLDTWGNQIDQKLQTLSYSVKQIKLGSTTMLKKVRQLRLVIKILRSYIQNPQIDTTQFQNLTNSMKIMEMLINLSKIITNKIGYIYPHELADPESPFCFAKNNLQELLKSIFMILLKLTKDNLSNSNTVISQVTFFNKILVFFPQIIGEILQQAIKNLSVFTTKNNNQTGSNQLFLWVKLIQPVRQQTIRIQKTYIDIIAQVVIDPKDRGIAQYQKRCKQLLFIQNSKHKSIPKFGISYSSTHSKPIIIFQNETMMNQFLQNNPQLAKLNLVHLNYVSYFIQDFYIDRYNPDLNLFEQYLHYIGSIINMFRNLCRNRNKKLFKIVDDWGINQEHIQLVFQSNKICWNLKANYLSLWSAIFIDQDPFLPFEKRQSKCHYWPKIQKYNLQQPTALIFKQYTDQSLASSKLSELSQKIPTILLSYFSHIKKQKKSLSSSSSTPPLFSNTSQLKSLYIVLNTLFEIINLGYLTLSQIKKYINVVLWVVGEDDMHREGEAEETDREGERDGDGNGDGDGGNLYGFHYSGNYSGMDQDAIKFHYLIIEKIIQILTLYEDIWVEIYGIEILIEFYKQSEEKKYGVSWQQIHAKWQDMLSNRFPQTTQVPKHSHARKRTRFHQTSTQPDNLLHYPHITSIEQLKNQNSQSKPQSYEKVDQKIQIFLIKCLLNKTLQQKWQKYSKLIQLLQKKQSRHMHLCKYLHQITILHTEQQQQIYRNFSCRQSNKLLNWLKIQQIVNKIQQIEQSNNTDEHEQRTKKQKILQLNNIVVKIVRQMKNYKNKHIILFRKCQLILEKLGVHRILLALMRYVEKGVYLDLGKSMLEFFRYFVEDCEGNCVELGEYIQCFGRNLNSESIVHLLPALVKASNKNQIAYKTAHQLIYKIKQSQTTIYLLIVIQKLLNLNPNSAQTQQLKTHLSRRIIQQFDFNDLFDQNMSTVDSDDKIIRTFQFIKILCKLAADCYQVQKKIKDLYSKSFILTRLKRLEDYQFKKRFLKLLVEIYIRNRDLENFEIEDYFNLLVLSELKKLPQICIKLRQKSHQAPHQSNSGNFGLEGERDLYIHNLYEDLLTYENVKIDTKDEEVYFNYILDFKDTDEVSVLVFAKLIVGMWKGSQKSKKLQIAYTYTKKLQQFLFLIFYQQSSPCHRHIFQHLQQCNILLEPHTAQPLPLQKSATSHPLLLHPLLLHSLHQSQTKEEIKQFYNNIADIIIEQKISIHQLFNCFNVNIEKLENKRNNYNVFYMLMEDQFIGCLAKLKKFVKRQEMLQRVMEGSEIFRFVSLCKDGKSRMIDVYYFIDKLMSLLEYKKNNKIKQQFEAHQKQEVDHTEDPIQSQSLNSYHSASSAIQHQFKFQIQKMIRISQTQALQTYYSNGLLLKIQEQVQKLSKKEIFSWVNDPSFNVLTIVQHYGSSLHLLYNFLFQIMTRAQQIGIDIDNIDINSFLRTISDQFQNITKTIIELLHQLLKKYPTQKKILTTIQKNSSKILSKLLTSTTQKKCQQNIYLLKTYQQLFVDMLNNTEISDNYKIKNKIKISDTIKKIIVKGVNMYCLYEFEVLEVLFGMWSQECCGVDYQLLGSKEFQGWLREVYSRKGLREVMGCSSKNVNRSKFTLLITKLIIKHIQAPVPSLPSPSPSPQPITSAPSSILQQLSKLEQSTLKIYQQFIVPKQKIFEKQDYCLGYAECSQFYCNNQKMSYLDQNLLHLILNLFVLVRIYGEKGGGRVSKLRERDRGDIGVFEDMLGRIKYKVNNRQKTYNFRLPNCHIRLNQDIKQYIISLLSSLPSEKIHKFLHPLSKVFISKLSIISSISRTIPPLACLFTYKKQVKITQLALLILLSLIELNFNVFPDSITNNQIVRYPFLRSACFISLVVNLVYFVCEMIVFRCKIGCLFPAVYLEQRESQRKLSSPQSSIFSKSSKRKIEITETQHNSELQINRDIKQNDNSYPIRLIFLNFVQSPIVIRILLILCYAATIIALPVLPLAIFIQAIDMQQSRTLIKQMLKQLFDRRHIIIINIILLIFSFYQYCTYFLFYQKQQPLSFQQVLNNFKIDWYYYIWLGYFQTTSNLTLNVHLNNQSLNSSNFYLHLILFVFVVKVVVGFVSVVVLVFFVAKRIAQVIDLEYRKLSRCWICLKDKESVQKNGCVFQSHVNQQHRLWDYLYFFSIYDKKGKLEDIQPQIEQQIKKGDYRFIKFY